MFISTGYLLSSKYSKHTTQYRPHPLYELVEKFVCVFPYR